MISLGPSLLMISLMGLTGPMWSEMMRHVLVAKKLWYIVARNEIRLVRANASTSFGDLTLDASSSAASLAPT